MAQFDVHRNLGTTKAEFPYFVVLQSSLFQESRRRVVIPLTRTTARLPQAERLNPVFEIEGELFSLMTLATLSLPKDRLGPLVTNLSGESDAIIAAVDWMMNRGFD
ncbi:CcdB family protein [Inquilinus sp. Marseille-Q2685]|uniref:CcdB family protein n=1 Tax=Inquilinus sp. Marseille-Q2685 TaxID=2866581 RepID=UPI001CE3F1BD|nr:CcdB family protein [Inquilinus sp. Marseille-Q2685]